MRSFEQLTEDLEKSRPLHESEKPVEIECFYCKGSGTTRHNHAVHTGGDGGEEYYLTCFECNGTGKVLEE